MQPAASPHLSLVGSEESAADERDILFLDRRMAAIVFVDVASSTSRLVEMTDREWCGVLDQLHDELSAIVARLGGTIANRMGDGYLVVFDGVSRAARFGQLAIEAARSVDLELRVGIHTGEIEQQGEHVAGVAIHTAARVQGVAEPGEIVVTEPVMLMTVGSGLEFDPRGEQELRGLPGRWRLWTLR